MMRKLLNMIKNTVRRAVVTLPGEDKGDFPVQQVSYLGKPANCTMISPYGHHANLPANNEVDVTMFAAQGQEDVRLGIGHTPKLRPRELPEGEFVFYHPLAKSKMQWKNNGDIEIDVTGDNGDLSVTIKKNLSITVSGDASINVAGDASIDIDGTATVNCPTTDWAGDVNFTGALTSNGKNVSDTHGHLGSATAPSGPVSPTGIVV